MTQVRSLLARGWFRGRRGGWLGTSAVLAATLAMLVLVSALFSGMQSETEARVADVFTGDLRITPTETGVFGAGNFPDGPADAGATGAAATIRMESQAILSKRSFTSILIDGDDAPIVQRPGGDGDVSLGVLIGASFADPAVAAPYERHMVRGTLPPAWQVAEPVEDSDPIPVAISVKTLGGFLTKEERDGLSSWPPPMSEIRNLRLDLTAGVAREGDYRNDVYRHSARVVGLYETGVETLDAFTIWGPIEAARFLLGHDPDGTVANVIVVQGETERAAEVAAAEGWAMEGSGSFTQRYLGQLITALQTLSLLTASVLFTIPAFLVAHGVERVLEAQKREVAVLRALGVPGRDVRSAMGRLVLLTVSIAVFAAAAITVLVGFALHGVLPAWRGAPVPLDVTFTWQAVAGGVAVALLSCFVAFLVAVRGQKRTDLTGTLRAL